MSNSFHGDVAFLSHRFPAGIIPIDTIFAHVTVEPGRTAITGSFSARMLNRPAKVFACSWIALVSAGVVSAQQPGGRATATAIRRAVVPPVTGITLDSARFVLGAFKLTPAIDPTTPGQSIVRTQNPAAGQPIPTDRNVQLTVGPARSTMVGAVSRGASAIAGGRLGPRVPRVTVPRVVGTASSVATRAIAAVGLKPAVRDTQMATPVPGIVVRQEPAGGDSVPPQTTVTIVVANGNQRKAMPNVLGLTRDAARVRLAADSILIGRVNSRVSEDSVDLVVSQMPLATQPLSVGSRATLTLGTQRRVSKVDTFPSGRTDSVVTQRSPPRDSGVPDSARNGADSVKVVVAESTAVPPVKPDRAIPDSVDVPLVTGHPLGQALRILRSNRLRANYAVNAAPTDTVAKQAPDSGRVPIDAIVVLTVKPRTHTVVGNNQPNLYPPIIAPTKNRDEPPWLPWWAIVLTGIGFIGFGSALWRALRKPPPESTPPQSEQAPGRDPGTPGDIPTFGTNLGDGTLDDSVQAHVQPLIARSMEFVPRLETVRSEIVGPFPAMQIIQKEGR